eukprot:5056725-Heterocapsa_arctica.AAC.1
MHWPRSARQMHWPRTRLRPCPEPTPRVRLKPSAPRAWLRPSTRPRSVLPPPSSGIPKSLPSSIPIS